MPRSIASVIARACLTGTAVALATTALALGGCTASSPVAYQGLSSSQRLRPAKDDDAPFQYRSPSATLGAYSKLIVDPVAIYDGPDGQFGSVSQEDRRIIADYMHKEFSEILRERYEIAAAPGPGTLRLQLTLTGLETSTPVLSTVSHVALVGLAVNTALEATNNNGTFFGSVFYAAELSDAATGDLLYAYVTRQTPDALDVTASFGYLDAAREGVRIGARHLKDNLSKGLATQAATTGEAAGQ